MATPLTVHLSGEIHSDWRERIISAAAQAVARTPEQVVGILRYVQKGELVRGG